MRQLVLRGTQLRLAHRQRGELPGQRVRSRGDARNVEARRDAEAIEEAAEEEARAEEVQRRADEVTSSSSSREEASTTASTARANASSFARDGFENPLTLRTYWSAAARTSSSVAGGS